jgi:meiotic recombination protein SPO11
MHAGYLSFRSGVTLLEHGQVPRHPRHGDCPHLACMRVLTYLVQGKGYADLLTREFLCLITLPSSRNQFHSCPVYGLFDFDPDGIGIFHTYKYGSWNTAHEGAHIACPRLQWLGLRSSDVFASTNEQSEHAVLQLTARDRCRASSMLLWPAFHEASEHLLKRELQLMLFLNQKAEIQLIDALPGGLNARLQTLFATL